MGDLQRGRRGVVGAAVLARMAAPYGRCSADAGASAVAPLVEAAPPKYDGYGRCPASERVDACAGPPAQGHRRLSALDARTLTPALRRLGGTAPSPPYSLV